MNELNQQLSDAVVAMNAEDVKRLSQRVLDEGFPPDEAIDKGLAAGMNRVGELFAAREYFVPEVLVCSRAMYAGFDILKGHVGEGKIGSKGTIAIGVVDGDFHDIGKNIVKLMLEAAGFRLIDLGNNVPNDRFIDVISAEKPAIIALSTLMTTTMESMESITADLLTKNPELKIMVGGAPVNQDFAKSIGAHFSGDDARQAVRGAHQLVGISFEA
jgi:corrinoid protein of di/trimethylamine methyltransferase